MVSPPWRLVLSLATGLVVAAVGCHRSAMAQPAAAPPTEQAYQGTIRTPDFAGRDRRYARFRTRIREQIAAGPNFAGRFAIIEIGCGTGCRYVFLADVSTGRVFDFPYSGGAFDSLVLTFERTSSVVRADWRAGNGCVRSALNWTGASFVPIGPRVTRPARLCD